MLTLLATTRIFTRKTRESIDVCNIIRLWVSILKGKVFAKRKSSFVEKWNKTNAKIMENYPTPFRTKTSPGFWFYRSWLLRSEQNEIYIYAWRKQLTPLRTKRDLYLCLEETAYSTQNKTRSIFMLCGSSLLLSERNGLFQRLENCYSKLGLALRRTGKHSWCNTVGGYISPSFEKLDNPFPRWSIPLSTLS